MNQKAKIGILFSRDEVAFLCNTINHALETIEGWEFETVTGKTPEVARDLERRLREILVEAREE